jgi:hypothetical protein
MFYDIKDSSCEEDYPCNEEIVAEAFVPRDFQEDSSCLHDDTLSEMDSPHVINEDRPIFYECLDNS